MRQGDFSGLVDNRTRRYTLYGPNTTDAEWSRIPFVNNQIPIDREGPLAKCLNSATRWNSPAPPRVLRMMRSQRSMVVEGSLSA